MDVSRETRLFTIGEAVAELQTTHPDISHSALRYLQREGMVNPVRTVGGHRLYTLGDLDRVRRIKRWQELRLSLADIRLRLERLDTLASPAEIGRRFLDLAMRGDAGAATEAVLHADDLGLPLAQLFDEVLRPVLVEVGERWAAGSFTVAQEHEISEVARDLIAELALRHARPDLQGPVVVAACVADELHDLGLRMICGVLRQRGARLHYLGANVSPPFLLDAIDRRDPDIVLLSVSLEEHLPALRDCLAALRESPDARPRPMIVAGGRGVAHAVQELAALRVRAISEAALDDAVDAIVAAWRDAA